MAKRAHLETWDLSRKRVEPTGRERESVDYDLSRLNIGNTLTLGTGVDRMSYTSGCVGQAMESFQIEISALATNK